MASHWFNEIVFFNYTFCFLRDQLSIFYSILSFDLTGLPQVWNSNAVKDEFMGQVVLSGLVNDKSDPQILQLRKRGRQMADEMPGRISLRIVTASQLTAI